MISQSEYDLPGRLTQIDPSWRDSSRPFSVIATGRLRKTNEGYDFFSADMKDPAFRFTDLFVELRGNYGNEMTCFLAEYQTCKGRKLEVIPAPFSEKLLAQSRRDIAQQP